MSEHLTKAQRERLLDAAARGHSTARRAIDVAVRSVHGEGAVEALRRLGRHEDAARFGRDDPDDHEVVWRLVEELNEFRQLRAGEADPGSA